MFAVFVFLRGLDGRIIVFVFGLRVGALCDHWVMTIGDCSFDGSCVYLFRDDHCRQTGTGRNLRTGAFAGTPADPLAGIFVAQ